MTAVEFYGEGVDTPWSDTQVYWLTWGARVGARIPTYLGRARGTAPVSFPSTVTWQPRQVYFAALINGDADNFFGPGLDPASAGDAGAAGDAGERGDGGAGDAAGADAGGDRRGRTWWGCS